MSLSVHRTIGILPVLCFCLAQFAALRTYTQDRFDPATLTEMDAAVRSAIAERRMPGGVLWVESKGRIYHKALGRRALLPEPEPMTEDTIFDVASLTKVLATTPSLMVLLERGRLQLDGSVVAYLPEFNQAGKLAITVRHLLTHTSGFTRSLRRRPDWLDFDSAFKLIAAEPLSNPPGARFLYSDINFIVLGEIVRRVSGLGLDQFADQEIFRPLKMVDTSFLPVPCLRSRIAPTEKIGRAILRGTVHDPKARSMQGVAGHAGLFTTAADVARFARMMLNEGELDGVRILKPETVKLMRTVQSPPNVRGRRGLGWDIDSDFSRPRGDLFPVGSYGHTGFTGVCLWIDPFSETFWMLLSNRLHPRPSRNIYSLQRTLATLAAEAVGGIDSPKPPPTP